MKKSISVLHIGKFYPPVKGGIEFVTKNICDSIKDSVKVNVVVSGTNLKTSREIVDGLTIVRVGSWGRIFSTSLSPAFLFEIRKFKTDIIHLHMPNPLAELSYLLNNNSARVVAHFHSVIVKPVYLKNIYSKFLEMVFKRIDKIIIPSPNHISVSPLLKKYQNKCTVIPYGIDTSKYSNLNLEQNAMIMKLSEVNPFVLFIGRLVYYKGLEVLLASIQNLDINLKIIGNGPLKLKLENIILKNNLSQKVEILGELTEKEKICYLHACSLLVLPSTELSEMFGMVQLEAMACGKPIISTSLPTGVSWVNINNITGLTVEPGNVQKLSNALILLLRNPRLLSEFGINGMERVKKEFSITRMRDSILSLYDSLL